MWRVHLKRKFLRRDTKHKWAKKLSSTRRRGQTEREKTICNIYPFPLWLAGLRIYLPQMSPLGIYGLSSAEEAATTQDSWEFYMDQIAEKAYLNYPVNKKMIRRGRMNFLAADLSASLRYADCLKPTGVRMRMSALLCRLTISMSKEGCHHASLSTFL